MWDDWDLRAERHKRTFDHPELYDFDLMYAQTLTGELGSQPLKELSYVVFDTETTGLSGGAGTTVFLTGLAFRFWIA